MPRRVYTKEELLKAWKEKEERLKKERDEVEAMKNIFELNVAEIVKTASTDMFHLLDVLLNHQNTADAEKR